MSSPPQNVGSFASARDLYALVDAIDDAAADVRRWPAVASKLVSVLPLDLADLPQMALSPGNALRLLQQARGESWSQEHIELLQFVCTRLDRAAVIHDRLADKEVRFRATSKALNHSLRAIVVVDKTAKVFTTNAGANEILAQKDGLYVEREFLRASRSHVDLELRQSIEMVSTRKFRWLAKSVPRVSAPEHLNLVLTTANALMRSGDREDLIVITITCPSRRVLLDPDVLRRMYSLTRSEANLACRLASGETVEQAAESLAISNNTARTHLKRIFMKTDTNRQSQLVLLLVQHTHNTAPNAGEGFPGFALQEFRDADDRRGQRGPYVQAKACSTTARSGLRM